MGVGNRISQLNRFGLVGALSLAVGATSWFCLDKVTANFLKNYRIEIERELSKRVGFKFKIGEYKGLRPWGLAVGPSEILPGSINLSSGQFKSVTIKFAPLSSLFNWRPVAIVNPKGAKIQLRRNNKGLFWSPILGKKGDSRKIDLRLAFSDPARILVVPNNSEFDLKTNVTLKLFEKKIKGRLNVNLPGKGNFFLKGNGSWDKLDFAGRARFNSLGIKELKEIIIENPPLEANGRINGQVLLNLKKGILGCDGKVNVYDLTLNSVLFTDTLSTRNAGFICNENGINFLDSKWSYGLFLASVRGFLPLGEANNLNLDLISRIGIKDNPSSELNIKAFLPLIIEKNKIDFGELNVLLDLETFPLASLNPLISDSLAGSISLKGKIHGKISSLKSDFSIGILNPQINNIRLQEEWAGKFLSFEGGGGDLTMSSKGASVPGAISAKFLNDWSLQILTIKRLGGQILVKKNENILDLSNDRYIWEAKDFRLDRIEIDAPSVTGFKRIFGELEGNGSFDTTPFAIKGLVKIRYARFLGFRLKEAQLEGKYFKNDYSFKGMFSPEDKGRISLQGDGVIGGKLSATAEIKKVPASWITKTALQFSEINFNSPKNVENVTNMGDLVVETLSDSLNSSLKNLANSLVSLNKNYQLNVENNLINPEELKGDIDAVVGIQGEDLTDLDLDLKASGFIRTVYDVKESKFKYDPIQVIVRGPVSNGSGDFLFQNVPLNLFSLIAPIPSSLNGSLGLSGKYRLEKGIKEVSANLILTESILKGKPFFLENGKIIYYDSFLNIDLALRSNSSLEPLKLVGRIPFSNNSPIDLKIESHGDGLKFLDGLSNGKVKWNKGTADLRLLIRGTLQEPEANGFLVINEGEFVVIDRVFEDLNSSILFDFNRLDVQSLKSNIGKRGMIKVFGAIPLFKEGLVEKEPLTIEMIKVPFKSPFADVKIGSDIVARGSLIKPKFSGEVVLKDGFISAKRSGNSKNMKEVDNNISTDSYRPSKTITLPEEKWDLSAPLVLFVEDTESLASKTLGNATPGFSRIGFDNLKLKLGPNLRITSQPLANFNISGALTLNGAFDQSLKPQGIIRLINGRVNLFTTTFDLDRREPNVAIFTPSMGLMPYVDVKMTSRVPDTVRDATDLASSNDFATNGSGAFGIGGSRFVNVEVTATGPADRISENLQLRSSPPLPRSQLLGLIGGNSLTRLLGGGEKEVLANLLSKSLISPVLGNITGSLSNRLKVSLYPAFIANSTNIEENADSSSTNTDENQGDLLPQQAWVTEMGIDLNKRFSFSVQATPNRKDIPPQGTLTFQVNSSLGLLGSLDKNGGWQSQLQLFLRF